MKKSYLKPKMELVELRHRTCLLGGSNNDDSPDSPAYNGPLGMDSDSLDDIESRV